MTIVIKTKNKKEEKELIEYFQSHEVEFMITKDGKLDTQSKKIENKFISKWKNVFENTRFTDKELLADAKLKRIYKKHVSR